MPKLIDNKDCGDVPIMLMNGYIDLCDDYDELIRLIENPKNDPRADKGVSINSRMFEATRNL